MRSWFRYSSYIRAMSLIHTAFVYASWSVITCAVLELVEAITLLSDNQLPDAIYKQAAENLSKEEVSAIEWLAVVINTWNGIASLLLAVILLRSQCG